MDDRARDRLWVAILLDEARASLSRGELRQGQHMGVAGVRLIVGTAMAGVVLVGCTTNGSSGPTTGSSASTSQVTVAVTALPTTSSPPSSDPNASATGTAMPLPVDLPVAAREQSAAGAEAFVRFFYQQMNRAWTQPAAGLIPPLCLSSSKSCAGIERVASQLVRDRQRYAGDPLTISLVVPLGAGSPSSIAVDVQGRQENRDVVDAQGKVMLTDLQKPAHFEVQLVRLSDGWRVATIMGVD